MILSSTNDISKLSMKNNPIFGPIMHAFIHKNDVPTLFHISWLHKALIMISIRSNDTISSFEYGRLLSIYLCHSTECNACRKPNAVISYL